MQTRREMQLRCIAGTSPLHLTTENSVVTCERGLKKHKLRRGTSSINDSMANRVIIHSLVLILRNVINPLVSLLNLRNQRPLTSRRPPAGLPLGLPLWLPRQRSAITVGRRTRVSTSATCHFHMLLQI